MSESKRAAKDSTTADARLALPVMTPPPTPDTPESSPTDAAPGITAFGTFDSTHRTKSQLWAPKPAAQPVFKRSVDPPDYAVTERQLNEVYTDVRSRLGNAAKEKLKVEELKWLREREAINDDLDAFVAFIQERIRVLNDMLSATER